MGLNPVANAGLEVRSCRNAPPPNGILMIVGGDHGDGVNVLCSETFLLYFSKFNGLAVNY
jgi:hypothetical protein